MAQTVFVNNADAYLGNALCVDLGVDYEVTGTLQGGFEGQVPPTCKKVVSRAVPSELLKHVTGCSTIVYDLHSCDLEELEFIVQGKCYLFFHRSHFGSRYLENVFELISGVFMHSTLPSYSGTSKK